MTKWYFSITAAISRGMTLFDKEYEQQELTASKSMCSYLNPSKQLNHFKAKGNKSSSECDENNENNENNEKEEEGNEISSGEEEGNEISSEEGVNDKVELQRRMGPQVLPSVIPPINLSSHCIIPRRSFVQMEEINIEQSQSNRGIPHISISSPTTKQLPSRKVADREGYLYSSSSSSHPTIPPTPILHSIKSPIQNSIRNSLSIPPFASCEQQRRSGNGFQTCLALSPSSHSNNITSSTYSSSSFSPSISPITTIISSPSSPLTDITKMTDMQPSKQYSKVCHFSLSSLTKWN